MVCALPITTETITTTTKGQFHQPFGANARCMTYQKIAPTQLYWYIQPKNNNVQLLLHMLDPVHQKSSINLLAQMLLIKCC